MCCSISARLNGSRSEEHTSELQSPCNLVCRLLLEKKKTQLDVPFLLAGKRPASDHAVVRPVGPGPGHDARGRQRGRAAAGALDLSFFFFNDTATTEIYTLSLHDALPISKKVLIDHHLHPSPFCDYIFSYPDRKSTRLNSSHLVISYAVFCLKKRT